jgi:predicted nucleic acid-binding Zn ribbon protein
MSKEELEKFPNHIENNSNEIEPTKNLCVHELRRRLKNKQRKQSIIKVIIFFTLTVLIGVISLFFY